MRGTTFKTPHLTIFMHKVRVYRYGKRQKDMYPYHNWLQRVWFRIVLFLKRLLVLSFLGGIVYLVAVGYNYANPKYVEVVKAQEVVKDPEYPVIERIAQAESHNSHYCTDELISAKMCRKSEKGQVLVRANNDKNKTVDVGRYQINVYYWGAKATELGYNIFDEEDNQKMAIWLFKNYGTEPWNSSKSNW